MSFIDELAKLIYGDWITYDDIAQGKVAETDTELITSIINLVDKELPKKEYPSGGKKTFDDTRPFDSYGIGYNQAISDMRAKLRGDK